MTILNRKNDWSDRRICGLAALVVAAFIVVGSLVPFDLSWQQGLGRAEWLEQVRFTPWTLVSGTDVFVNAAVGTPLGFFVMGAFRSGRRGSRAIPLIVATAISALMGTTVELLQVLSTLRQSSWNDVLAQGLGAGVGAVGWMAIGPQVVLWLRHLANEREPSGFAARLLQLYLPVYLLVQLTPFEAIRAAEIPPEYHPRQIVLVPAPDALESTLLAMREFVGNALLNMPIGMLAVLGWVRRSGRRRVWQAVLLGFAMVLMVAAAPSPVRWSQRVLSELLAGALGVVAGVAAATAAWSRPAPSDSFRGRRRFRPWLLLAAVAWTLVLVGQAWQPSNYELTAEMGKGSLPRLSVVPFDSYRLYSASPLQALHETVLEFLVAFPLGLLLRMAWPIAGLRRIRRLQVMTLVGVVILVLAAVEFGQVPLPMRVPDVMDMLIGAAGATAGVASGAPFSRRQNSGDGFL